MKEQAEEMLERSGFKDVYGYESKYVFGNGIHEMVLQEWATPRLLF